MAFGYGIPGGYGGGSIGDGPQFSPFRRRNEHRPSSNAESLIYPHASPAMPVGEYVKEAAARAWLLPVRNWQNAADPITEHRILHADPWRPRLVEWPLGYTEGATGSTNYFAQCWEFNRDGKGKRILEKLSKPIPPDGFNLYLVVSGVTWQFTKTKLCSTSLIARIEGINKYEAHEKFMMERAGKLLADLEAWLKGA